MFSELDTDAFFAYAKAHHRDLVQQAEMDALRRRVALQKQDRAPRPRRRLALRRSLRHGQRAARLRSHRLWQRWILVARTWASGHSSHTPRTSRG
jgi:hypothetical protein